MSSPWSPDGDALSIHLDLVGGIAGDMFVAAMVDALPALEAPILEALAAVRPGQAAMPEFARATSAGIAARRFGFPSKYRVAASPGSAYPDLVATIGDAALDAATRSHALALLALLGEAEARVHGTSIDNVHFHELADWDSLMDVVAAGCIAARLSGATWTCSALPLGGGRVKTAHGLLPVPAPATSALLQGYPWRDDGIDGERVTPTGAAIVRHLVPRERATQRCRGGRLTTVGCGAGTRSLGETPNIVRAMVFETVDATNADDTDADFVTSLEFDVDDMTGEEIALAGERLRALGGVLDVSIGTRIGKKGRPLSDFRVLARVQDATSVMHACFTETSTLGVRVREERRQVLRRRDVRADAVTVKVAERPGGVRTGKAAHDDVASDASLDARRQARATAESRALEDDE
jgi:pyridinium-3,5-bisthiocarboxylic acid mononucleotide nickel chelatase